jgi:hypothetical protein
MEMALSQGLLAGFTNIGLTAAVVGGILAGVLSSLGSVSQATVLVTVLAASFFGWMIEYRPWGPGSIVLDIFPLVLYLIGSYVGFLIVTKRFHRETS